LQHGFAVAFQQTAEDDPQRHHAGRPDKLRRSGAVLVMQNISNVGRRVIFVNNIHTFYIFITFDQPSLADQVFCHLFEGHL
jgi:hypothetical protein